MSLTHGVGEFFALDIGTHALRLVQLSGSARTGWTLQRFAYVPVDKATVQDSSDAGKRKLGEVVMKAVQQAGIRTRNVAVGMPAGKTYTTIIEVPNQDAKGVEKIIKYELDQYIPMAVEDAKVDFAVLGPSPNDPTKAEVLLSSVAVAFAEEKMEMLESFGLNVVAQEPDQIAMARALAPPGATDGRMIIDYGETATDLVVTYGGVPRLVRTIPGGLSVLVKTTANYLSVKEDQARQFILKFGLAQDKLDGQVFKALDSTLENFASELSKSVRFFQTKYPQIKVGGIILSGFAGTIPFMSEYIEAKTSVSTSQGNPWQLVRVTADQQQALSQVASEFAVAIGLAERMNNK
ncbi:pilus assembly protein PilM [Candidatus Saccharibacteria bacterium]|nr:pilus assembly protein PilM [Candidatus Saccharibacteria bacterium]